MPEWEVTVPIDDIEQWEGVEHIVQGNVFYGEVNNIEATRIDDDEEEESR